MAPSLIAPLPYSKGYQGNPTPETNVRHTDPVIHVVQPVQPVIIQHEYIPSKPVVQPVAPPQSPPIVKGKEPNNSAPKKRIEPTIRPEKNSGNSKNSVSPPKTELNKPNETKPLEPFERIGKVGRQRKNEEKGKRGENSVRQVVLYRHIKGRQYPGLSSDMKRWYEFFYFKAPLAGEKPFNANTSYEQHVEAYERGQDWIRRYEFDQTARPVGDSRPIDLQARRAAH